ncbi:hypothetical protein BS78_05G146000 [Paspalum vaginatum]|nr:hypothetical protein BS78_05G146000 [Paspalum vaginatum]
MDLGDQGLGWLSECPDWRRPDARCRRRLPAPRRRATQGAPTLPPPSASTPVTACLVLF